MDNKKLVSKNSVQKFKWGNKIIKADNGIVLNILGHKTEIGPTASKVLRKMKKAYNYYKVNSGATEDFGLLYGRTGDPITFIRNVIDGNVIDPNQKSNEKIIPKNDKNSKKNSITITKSSTLVTKPRFLSKYSNMSNVIGGANNIKAWQEKLKDYYAPNTYNPDSIWGANTQAAYEKYLEDQTKQNVKFGTSDMIADINDTSGLEKAKEIVPSQKTVPVYQNDFALDKLNYPSYYDTTYFDPHAKELFDKVVLRNPGYNFNYNPYSFSTFKNPFTFNKPIIFSKQGSKLLKKNSINKFKKGGNLVPKFQAPWGTLMLNELDKRQQALQDFSNKGINQAKQVVSPMEKQTKKAHNRNNKIASLQLQLWNSGAFNGVIDKRTGKQVTYERAVDGIDGSMTRQAMENNKKRREAIPLSPRNQQIQQQNNQQKTKFVTTSGSNIPSQIFELNNPTYISDNSKVQSLNLDQASKLYQNGTGNIDIYLSGLYHAVAPESWTMPHSEGLKNQIAAAIAYNEGVPASQREKDPHNMNNGTYIGYDTYGRLSNQLTTVGKNNKVVGKYINSQSNSNNGAAKVMGGLRYKINDDNSVDVEDPYGFNVSRDFTRTNSHGQPYVYKKGEDPYAGHEWKGLYHDITTSGEGRSIQNIMENFFTRQGKSRKNNIHFEPGEINSRNQLL